MTYSQVYLVSVAILIRQVYDARMGASSILLQGGHLRVQMVGIGWVYRTLA